MALNRLKHFVKRYLPASRNSDLSESLGTYLNELCSSTYPKTALPTATHEADKDFLARLDILLTSENAAVQKATVSWVLENLHPRKLLPAHLREGLIDMVRHTLVLSPPDLARQLLLLLDSDIRPRSPLYRWLSELAYSSYQRQEIIEPLVTLYLSKSPDEAALLEALITLDKLEGDVTDWILHQFPHAQTEQNHRMIALLGKLGRYRAIKPLIRYVDEYPEYLKSVMKALAGLRFDDVDTFYIRCLDPGYQRNTIVLIEAIRQIRKRRLRKATPSLEALFPMELDANPLINRAVNGEIAVTLGSFGGYLWAKENLLKDMVLNGIQPKYLETIDMLQLDDAVPLLKAIFLLPETPDIAPIQEQAYQICDRLLSKPRQPY